MAKKWKVITHTSSPARVEEIRGRAHVAAAILALNQLRRRRGLTQSQYGSSYDMKKHDHLGLVAQAILAELAQGHPCSAEELAHALQQHGHEATLTSICRNVDDLRDRKWVAFVQPTSEEAEWAIEDAAKIASRMRGETAAPMRYTPRFVMTPLGRKNGDAPRRSG